MHASYHLDSTRYADGKFLPEVAMCGFGAMPRMEAIAVATERKEEINDPWTYTCLFLSIILTCAFIFLHSLQKYQSSGGSPSADAWANAGPSQALPFATAPATLDGSMLGETACNKRVEAWAARQFRDVRGSVETHRFD